MTYRSKISQSNANVLRQSMKKKTTLNAWIKYYQDLLLSGKVSPDGYAYKRMLELQDRRIRVL